MLRYGKVVNIHSMSKTFDVVPFDAYSNQKEEDNEGRPLICSISERNANNLNIGDLVSIESTGKGLFRYVDKLSDVKYFKHKVLASHIYSKGGDIKEVFLQLRSLDNNKRITYWEDITSLFYGTMSLMIANDNVVFGFDSRDRLVDIKILTP